MKPPNNLLWLSRPALAFALVGALSACADAPKADQEASAEAVPEITAFGVPECDDYVSQYLTCIDRHVTGDQKQKLLEALEANQTKWRAIASMQQGAIALSLACRTAAQTSKEALTLNYGCEF